MRTLTHLTLVVSSPIPSETCPRVGLCAEACREILAVSPGVDRLAPGHFERVVAYDRRSGAVWEAELLEWSLVEGRAFYRVRPVTKLPTSHRALLARAKQARDDEPAVFMRKWLPGAFALDRAAATFAIGSAPVDGCPPYSLSWKELLVGNTAEQIQLRNPARWRNSRELHAVAMAWDAVARDRRGYPPEQRAEALVNVFLLESRALELDRYEEASLHVWLSAGRRLAEPGSGMEFDRAGLARWVGRLLEAAEAAVERRPDAVVPQRLKGDLLAGTMASACLWGVLRGQDREENRGLALRFHALGVECLTDAASEGEIRLACHPGSHYDRRALVCAHFSLARALCDGELSLRGRLHVPRIVPLRRAQEALTRCCTLDNDDVARDSALHSGSIAALPKLYRFAKIHEGLARAHDGEGAMLPREERRHHLARAARACELGLRLIDAGLHGGHDYFRGRLLDIQSRVNRLRMDLGGETRRLQVPGPGTSESRRKLVAREGEGEASGNG
jgi:hypothetical protein